MRILPLLLLLGVAVPSFASSPDPKRLAVPPEDMLKAQELVRQLGSDEFTIREEAQERLAKLGGLVGVRKTELYHWRCPRNVGFVPAGGGVGTGTATARRDPTPADITTLLFAESFVESHKVPRTIAVSTLFTTPGFNQAVQDG